MKNIKKVINSKLKPFIHSSSFILFGTIPTKSGQGFFHTNILAVLRRIFLPTICWFKFLKER
ncbi:MAG: hypothetical protein WC557_04285 [Ignavibacteriaceae bacterium]